MEYSDSRRIKEIRDNTAKMADAFTRIADALERLADRKTDNSSEKPNNCEDKLTGYKLQPVEDEPQTEYDKYREKIRPHDPHKDWFETEP